MVVRAPEVVESAKMQVHVFLSKHGLAAHAERLDLRGLCDDLSCLLALELPHTLTLSLTLTLTLTLPLTVTLALTLTLTLSASCGLGTREPACRLALPRLALLAACPQALLALLVLCLHCLP